MKVKVRERRISKPQHIRALMQEQINLLRRNERLDDIDRARAIAYLSNVALTAIKDSDFDERLRAIEQQLEQQGRL